MTEAECAAALERIIWEAIEGSQITADPAFVVGLTSDIQSFIRAHWDIQPDEERGE